MAAILTDTPEKSSPTCGLRRNPTLGEAWSPKALSNKCWKVERLTLRQENQYLFFLATLSPVCWGPFPCSTALFLQKSQRAGPVLQEFWLVLRPGVYPCLCTPSPALGLQVVVYLVKVIVANSPIKSGRLIFSARIWEVWVVTERRAGCSWRQPQFQPDFLEDNEVHVYLFWGGRRNFTILTRCKP